jgi:FkbM family methyltransferase
MRQFRRAALRLAGIDPRISTDIAVPTTLLGGEGGYGGWYVATDLLPPNPRVLSLGIGTDISFDIAMIHRFGARIVGCDPTPIARKTVIAAKLSESSFRLLDCAVSDFDGPCEFSPVMVAGVATGCSTLGNRTNGDKSSPNVQVRSLKRVVEECFESAPDVLKLDVEGAEYPAKSSLSFITAFQAEASATRLTRSRRFKE